MNKSPTKAKRERQAPDFSLGVASVLPANTLPGGGVRPPTREFQLMNVRRSSYFLLFSQ